MSDFFKGHERENTDARTCVTPDARILLDDRITEISVQHLGKRLASTMVASFDGTRGYFFPCRVKSCIREDAHLNEKRVIYIRTISGRNIKVTDDHLFQAFGKRWIPAGLVQKGDRLAIYPSLDPLEQHPSCEISKNILSRMSRRNPINLLRKTRVPELVGIEEVIPLMNGRLNSQFTMSFRKNFPLTLDHTLLPTWARLLGYLITSIRFNSDLILTFQDEKDWMQVQTDFQRLGIRTQSTRRNGVNIIIIDSVLLELFKLIVFPPRFLHANNEPLQWMLDAPLAVIREFLAGLLGRNGKAPWIDHPLSGNETITFPGLKIEFNDDLLKVHGPEIISVVHRLFSKMGIQLTINNDLSDSSDKFNHDAATWLFTISSDDPSAISLLTRYVGFRYNHVESVKSNFVAEFFRFLEFVNSQDGKQIPELATSRFPSAANYYDLNRLNANSASLVESGKTRENNIENETTKSNPESLPVTKQSPPTLPNKEQNRSQNQQQPAPSTMISEEEMLEIDGDLFVWQVESQTITSFHDFLYACRADFETGLLHEPVVLLGDVLDRDVRKITVASHTQIYIVNGFLSR